MTCKGLQLNLVVTFSLSNNRRATKMEMPLCVLMVQTELCSEETYMSLQLKSDEIRTFCWCVPKHTVLIAMPVRTDSWFLVVNLKPYTSHNIYRLAGVFFQCRQTGFNKSERFAVYAALKGWLYMQLNCEGRGWLIWEGRWAQFLIERFRQNLANFRLWMR